VSLREFRGSRLHRVLITGLVLLVLAGGTVLVIMEGVPRLLGMWISSALRERQIEPEKLAVERAGPTATRFAPGSLNFRGQSFSWQSLEIDYSPMDLWSGRVGQVSLQAPHLSIQWPFPLTQEAAPVEVNMERIPQAPAADGSREIPATGQEAASPPPAERAMTKPPPLVLPAPSFLPDYAELLGLFDALPLARLSTHDGDFGLALFGQPEVTGDWEAFLLNGPELLTGKVFLDAGTATFFSTISGVKSAKAISIHSDLHLQPAFMDGIRERLSSSHVSPWEHLELLEEVSGEILFDWVGPGLPAISAEATLGSVAWMPLDGVSLRATSLMVLGTYAENNIRLNAGCRIDQLSWKAATVSPFSIRGSYTGGDRIRVESERFTATLPGWSGQFAMRGSALPQPGGMIPEGQLELAFTNLAGPAFSIEPASLLFRTGENLGVRASPIGLKRRTTLWIEELTIEADYRFSRVSGGFTWYNAAGAHMGAVRVSNDVSPGEALNGVFQLEAPSGEPFMEGDFAMAGKSLDTAVRGELPTSWLNALNDWGGWFPGRFSGAAPVLDVSLTNLTAFPRGTLSLSFSGSGFAMGEDISVDGINGEIPLEFLGLPRTRSEQQWTILSASTGSFTVNDIRIRWSLPTMRTLRIHELSGSLGGGTVRVDPFDVDPLDPQPVINLEFTRLQADLFLDWYGENRFAVEGTLSGKLGLQWLNGIWLIGRGGLRIDNSDTDNRFVFTDEAFLREQFGSLAGVPEDLKRPLLAALLEKGIRIDDLELQLEPVPGADKVSLKLTLTGETVTEEIEVPIRGLVINNLIARDDLARLLGLFGPVRFIDDP
jgi:hypothetical protein